MNKFDRKELERARTLLTEAQEIVSAVAEGEQDKFDNLNEGLQASAMGQRFEEVAGELEEVAGEIDMAADNLGEHA